jgi:hypothetical protein
LLHQRQRQTDDAGRLVACADDYQLARHLLAKPMARLLGEGVSDKARRFYDRLKAWVEGEFTSTEAKKHERNCKSSVYLWVAKGVARGGRGRAGRDVTRPVAGAVETDRQSSR